MKVNRVTALLNRAILKTKFIYRDYITKKEFPVTYGDMIKCGGKLPKGVKPKWYKPFVLHTAVVHPNPNGGLNITPTQGGVMIPNHKLIYLEDAIQIERIKRKKGIKAALAFKNWLFRTGNYNKDNIPKYKVDFF